jgi:hypothetical protein
MGAKGKRGGGGHRPPGILSGARGRGAGVCSGPGVLSGVLGPCSVLRTRLVACRREPWADCSPGKERELPSDCAARERRRTGRRWSPSRNRTDSTPAVAMCDTMQRRAARGEVVRGHAGGGPTVRGVRFGLRVDVGPHGPLGARDGPWSPPEAAGANRGPRGAPVRPSRWTARACSLAPSAPSSDHGFALKEVRRRGKSFQVVTRASGRATPTRRSPGCGAHAPPDARGSRPPPSREGSGAEVAPRLREESLVPHPTRGMPALVEVGRAVRSRDRTRDFLSTTGAGRADKGTEAGQILPGCDARVRATYADTSLPRRYGASANSTTL